MVIPHSTVGAFKKGRKKNKRCKHVACLEMELSRTPRVPTTLQKYFDQVVERVSVWALLIFRDSEPFPV